MKTSNLLLDALPREAHGLDIETKEGKLGDVLMEADELPAYAYFPSRGTLISQTRSAESGATVEVGIAGHEGFSSVQTLLWPAASGSMAVIQVAGPYARVKLEKLRNLFYEERGVRDVLLQYAAEFIGQVSQHVICNRLHSIEQRLAKWLLSVRDRIGSDEMALTHEFLSFMLGIRRSGVTVALGALALDGLISNDRGLIVVRDPAGIEALACECYEAMSGGK
jgi:CRP-like cAMP-binding protein